jgi:hypothetical protein
MSSKTELRFGGHGSLSIDLAKGTWYDHESQEGGGVLDLVRAHAGLTETRDVMAWLEAEGYLNGKHPKPAGPRLGTEIAHYDYVDEAGDLVMQVVRYDPKDFRQRRPDGRGGWIKNVKGVRLVPYRLPELQESLALDRPIFIVEGEKDADNLIKFGVPATTNPMGAGNWQSKLNAYFADADVVVISDNDPQTIKAGVPQFHPDGRPKHTGQDHADHVCEELQPVARRARHLNLGKLWPECPSKGDISVVAGGTPERLYEIVDQLSAWSPPKPSAADGPAPTMALNETDAGDDPAPIPPRGWLLANQFCRRFLSSLVATGGTGKTALRMLQYLALATGRPLTGEHVFRRCRVLMLSFEDDIDDLNRRLAAALIHHKIARAELKGWLYVAAPKGAKLAEMHKGTQQVGQLEKMLRDAIIRRRPDIIGLDPFVKLHALDENDNGAMDFVCDLLARLAIEQDIAIDAPHHTKKGTLTPGDADTGRGASGIKDAGRLVYTLTAMTEADAAAFNISDIDRRQYIRLDPAKVNIAPRAQSAQWFRVVGVRLDNGTDDYPNGDEVQTVEPWMPPSACADTSVPVLNAILDDIARGKENGQRYSNAPNAGKRAVVPVVQKHYPNKPEGDCRRIIHTWLDSGLLYDKKYSDPVEYKPRNGLYVDDAKRPS